MAAGKKAEEKTLTSDYMEQSRRGLAPDQSSTGYVQKTDTGAKAQP